MSDLTAVKCAKCNVTNYIRGSGCWQCRKCSAINDPCIFSYDAPKKEEPIIVIEEDKEELDGNDVILNLSTDEEEDFEDFIINDEGMIIEEKE